MCAQKSEKDPVAFLTNLSEMADARARRVGHEAEPVAASFRHGNASWRRYRDLNRGRILHEGPSKPVCRVAESGDYSTRPAPFQAQRVDDPLNQVSKWSSKIDAIRDSEGVEHADVLGMQRCAAATEVCVSTTFRNVRGPKDRCG